MSSRFRTRRDGIWLRIYNGDGMRGITGKYLFFSDDKELLLENAKEIMQTFSLTDAKINFYEKSKHDDGFGHVLCIYDTEPRFKLRMAQYGHVPLLNYRGWKFDADTLAGKYSKKFLEAMSRG